MKSSAVFVFTFITANSVVYVVFSFDFVKNLCSSPNMNPLANSSLDIINKSTLCDVTQNTHYVCYITEVTDECM